MSFPNTLVIHSRPYDYTIRVHRDSAYGIYRFGIVLDDAPDIHRIDITQDFITPEVLLLLKFYIDQTLLDPGSTTLSSRNVNILNNLLHTHLPSPNLDRSAHYFRFPFLSNPRSILRTTEPRFSSTITLRSIPDNYEIKVSSYQLFNKSIVHGLIGEILNLAGGVDTIEFDNPHVTSTTLMALEYLTTPYSDSEYTKASRYLLIDELNDPIIQQYVSCVESVSPIGDIITLRSIPYDMEVSVSKDNLLKYFPDSMPARVIELDPSTILIPIYTDFITPKILQGIVKLINRPIELNPDMVESAKFLGIPGLANLYLSELVTCQLESGYMWF